MTSTNDDPPIDATFLEPAESEGVYPGGLVQHPLEDPLLIGTPEDLDNLGYTDELGPHETLWVGPYSQDDLVDAAGRKITSHGEFVYVVDVYPNAGMAQRHFCRSHHLNNKKKPKLTPKTLGIDSSAMKGEDGRGPRARADFIRLARSNSLGMMVELDYFDHPNDYHRYPKYCKKRLREYLRRLRRRTDPFPWLEVLEYGGETFRLHHHLLVPQHLNSKLLREIWTDGGAKTQRLRTLDEIGSKANYLTKTFEQPEDMRPRTRRYRIGRRVQDEQPIRLIGTRESIDANIRKMVPRSTEIREWHSTHPFSAGGFTWDKPV